MPTMNKKKTDKTKPPASKEPLLDHTDEQQHLEAVKHLQAECMEVSYSVSWLPLSRAVTAENRRKMVSAVNGGKGLKTGKAMFVGDHPLIKDLNKTRTRLEAWRNSFTIVKGAELTTDGDEKPTVVSGVRLIEVADIPEFESGFQVRVDEMYSAAARVQEYMRKPYFDGKKEWPSILEFDRAAVGDDFNEADYPDRPADCVKVTVPDYHPYEVSIKLPPQVQARQEQRLQESLNGTLETATTYITNTINEVFSQFANQLANRTRIYPTDKALQKYSGAEVISRKEGWTKIRYKEADPDNPGKERSVITTLDQMSDADYATKLKPQTTDERRKLATSTLANLMEQLDNVGKVGTMLGPYGKKIEETLKGVRDILSTAGSKPEEILKEARNSTTYRDRLVEALDGATERLEETAVEVKKVRRKLSRKLIDQLHAAS
jgi:hypothetical protein